MSKFCNNCGSVMEDDAVFCTNCGAKEAPAAPVAPAAAPNYSYAGTPQQPEGGKKGLPFALIGAIAIVAVVILAIVLFAGGGHKDVAKNLEAVLNGKANKLESLAPKAFWEYMEDEHDVELKDLKEDFEDNYEDALDELEDEYGKNVKFTVKVTDSEKMDKDDVKDIAKAIDKSYDIDKDKIKAAYELELEMTIKGKDEKDEQDMDIVAVKISGKWYPVIVIDMGGQMYVSFLAGSIGEMF